MVHQNSPVPIRYQNISFQLTNRNGFRNGICKARLSGEISLELVIIVAFRPEIPPLLRDNLALPLILQLVFLNPLILVNPIH